MSKVYWVAMCATFTVVQAAFGAEQAVQPVATPTPTVTITIDASKAGQRQVIDGFGTCGTEGGPADPVYQQIYYGDMMCSMQRVDITPAFKAPFTGENKTYNSPWFHKNPAMPGPEGNNVRTYTSAADYGRLYNGWHIPIAVMGPNIDDNISRCLDFDTDAIKAAGECAKVGQAKIPDFKLIASVWSPAPWVKVATGRTATYDSEPMPKGHPAYPFIWFNNFAGGKVDTSGAPLKEFDDSSLPGGHGPTSALTQYARCLAAYLRGFQNKFGVRFYSVSLQNEPNLELFYNSCGYLSSKDYIAVLKVARAELDKYPDLKPIKIMGFEDTIGSESTYLWFWNDQNVKIDKCLKVMQDVEADPVASKALAFYIVHGYAADGIQSSGAEPAVWEWVRSGWDKAPNPQVPDNVKGYESYGKKCWMTETSGEDRDWLSPKTGFPNNGAYSIALKIQQALTVGDVTAWLYWQMGSPTATKPDDGALIYGPDPTAKPKYLAAKHFFRYIRPGAQRLESTSTDSHILCSTFVHRKDRTLTMVLVNTSDTTTTAAITVPHAIGTVKAFDAYSSSEKDLWTESAIHTTGNVDRVSVPGYGVVTLVGRY